MLACRAALLLAACWIIMLAGCASSQRKSAPLATKSATIAVGDMISIEIEDGGPSEILAIRVEPSGTVKLPYLGQLQLAGQTEMQVKRAILDALEKRADPPPRAEVRRLVPLTVGDRLSIEIYDFNARTTSNQVVGVLPNGKVTVHHVGELPAARLNEFDVRQRLLGNLRERKADVSGDWEVRVRRLELGE